MPLPTFVIVGAQKSGTSSLAATLRRHPEVHLARPKELHFFDRDYDKGLDYYAGLFRPARRRNKAWGEATPVYLYDDEARDRLCAALPEARLVVILREPAARAYSHFWHSKRMGFEPLDSFEEALAREPERLASSRQERIRFSYVDRGHYLRQLQALEQRHGRDRIHVMLLDDLRHDREQALADLFAFLGVSTEPAHEIEEQWTNRYRVKESPDGPEKVVEYPRIDPATRARLVEHYRPHNEALAAYLGRDLSAWQRP